MLLEHGPRPLATGCLAPENDPNIVDIGGKLRFERERVARTSTSAWISTTHEGVIEGIDLAGVTIQTDL